MNGIPLLLAIFGMGFWAAVSFAAERPNVILFMTDDQGWGQTGYNNHPVLKTPNLDAMAANGLRFDRFYAASAVCSPTRAAVLTGRTPERCGVPSHGHALRLQEKPMPKALRAAGYATGHFGKWHLNALRGPGVPLFGDDSHHPGVFGFDTWLTTSNFFDLNPILSRNGEWEEFEGDSSDVIAREALAFIKTQVTAEKPFLAVVWDGSPHSPFMANDPDMAPFAGMNKVSREHYAELVAVDRAVGKMRRELRELGVADNTLFWFHSDNGGLGNVRPDSTGGLRGSKGTIYEGGLRVPGIVEWPARITPRITKYPAGAVDIFPTLAELLDLPEHAMLQPQDGLSLAPLFDKELGPRSQPLGFRYRGSAAWIDNDHKVVRESKDQFSLYNLVADKTESKNLAKNQPERHREMVDALKAWEAGVDRSIAGKDYPEGSVNPGEPESHFWMEDDRYKPFLKKWSTRPEYAPRLLPKPKKKQK